jgi:integrase
MPHVYRTKDKHGRPHARWRFRFRDRTGRRRAATGYRSREQTVKLALDMQADEDAIRKGYRPAPLPAARHRWRPFAEAAHEWLEWGESQGGRGGRPWGPTHARMRRTHMRWWQDALRLEVLGDLPGCLPRAEAALRELQAGGATGKTLANYAEALRAFCRWCVDRQYLDQDPLARLAAFDTTPNVRRRALTSAEIRQLLEHCAPRRRLTYQVALATGLRARELASLTAAHFSPELGGLHLSAEWTKGRPAGGLPGTPRGAGGGPGRGGAGQAPCRSPALHTGAPRPGPGEGPGGRRYPQGHRRGEG